MNSFEEENKQLKAEIAALKSAKKEKWHSRLRWSKKLSGYVLGKNLKTSITQFFTELEEKRSVSKHTVADLLSAIFMRVTRIGVYLIITSLLPTLFLLFQLYYLSNQNELITFQNKRLEQQTYLQEADRRAYLTGVLDEMIKEVTAEGYRNSGKISRVNSNRLIAISKILKPYKYLENDSLIKAPLSPERGYLLLSLLESNLELGVVMDKNTRESLLSQLNFNYAELQGASLTGLDINNIVLDYTNLDNSNFTKSTFIKSSFKDASLVHTNFYKSDIMNCNFAGADLSNASFADSDLTNINFNGAKLKGTNFSNCKLTKLSLKETNIIGAKFNNAVVSSNWINEQEENLDAVNFDYLEEHWRIKTEDKRSILKEK